MAKVVVRQELEKKKAKKKVYSNVKNEAVNLLSEERPDLIFPLYSNSFGNILSLPIRVALVITSHCQSIESVLTSPPISFGQHEASFPCHHSHISHFHLNF